MTTDSAGVPSPAYGSERVYCEWSSPGTTAVSAFENLIFGFVSQYVDDTTVMVEEDLGNLYGSCSRAAKG